MVTTLSPVFGGISRFPLVAPTCLLSYPELERRDLLALAFYLATDLPLLVAIAEIGEHTGGTHPGKQNAVASENGGL